MIREYTAEKPKLILPENCPPTGQFVAVWEANNKIWAHTYKWVNSDIHKYNHDMDDFIKDEGTTYGWQHYHNNAQFYVQK